MTSQTGRGSVASRGRSTDSGPVHRQVSVLTSKRVGAYTQLTLASSEIARAARPGTFLAVSVDPLHWARRSFWIHRSRPQGAYGGTVDILVDPVGVGSRWLAEQPKGAELQVTGPLGRGFPLPKEPVNTLLVGAGYSAGPLFALAEGLRSRGCEVHLLLGAEDDRHLLSPMEARRTARTVTVTSGDGSVGRRGAVVDAVADALAQSAADVVYALGEPEEMRQVARSAHAYGAWSYLGLQVPQPCGTGLCHACVVPVSGAAGTVAPARACAEGPVFRGDRVLWEGGWEVRR